MPEEEGKGEGEEGKKEKKGKKEKEDVYQKLESYCKAFDIYYWAKKKGRWDEPEVREDLPNLLGYQELQKELAPMPTHGFIHKIERELLPVKEAESNLLLYNNFYELLKKHSIDEIGNLFASVPFKGIPPEKMQDKNLQEIAKIHATITAAKAMTAEQYREMVFEEYKKTGKGYAELTLPLEVLEEEKNLEIVSQTNYLKAMLKKIKGEKKK
jgi:hypothetical protein